ncbi:MAG: GntR family transcriptional regulator [Acidobacteria bacterium]|nr:GntR family transcriptional regulator [Acidobacteriota bacterium]
MPRKEPAVFKNLNSEKNGTTAEEVVSRLRDMIHSGELSAGDRLPRSVIWRSYSSEPAYVACRDQVLIDRRHFAVATGSGHICSRAWRFRLLSTAAR